MAHRYQPARPDRHRVRRSEFRNSRQKALAANSLSASLGLRGWTPTSSTLYKALILPSNHL